MPRTLKLTLAYDGAAYAGWQRQDTARTVQAEVEDGLTALFGARWPVMAAGRTDAGVHAAAQVASVVIDHPIRCDDLVRALNTRLPLDIRLRRVEEMDAGFSARAGAVSKTYRYTIWNRRVHEPSLRGLAWHVPQRLDTDAMSAAAAVLVGDHDFGAFQASGADVKTTRRRLLASDVLRVAVESVLPIVLAAGDGPAGAESPLIRYEVTGTGFLRHMVRIIAGTLVDIGRGALPVSAMPGILASRDRRHAGTTAPAHGLTLWRVDY